MIGVGGRKCLGLANAKVEGVSLVLAFNAVGDNMDYDVIHEKCDQEPSYDRCWRCIG